MENIENVKPKRRSLNDGFLGFRGSENYYRHSNLFSNFFLTDGVKHITDNYGLSWFLDTVLSYQGDRVVRAIKFQIWTLERITEGDDIGQWKVVMYLEKTPVIMQLFDTISLTDNYEDNFDIFKIYLVDNELFLPSENWAGGWTAVNIEKRLSINVFDLGTIKILNLLKQWSLI